MSCVGETSKKVKLPKKFLLDCHWVDDVYVPRRLRTGITKRLKENVSPSSQCPTNWIHKNKTPLENSSSKKTNVYVDKQRHSTMLKLFAEQITEDEKEAIAGLLALARINAENNNTNKINLNKEIAEAEDSKCKDLVVKHVQIHDLIDSNTVDVKKDSKDITDNNKSRKRCCSHMYICGMIKNLQIIEGRKNWQNGRHELMVPHSGSYVQATLVDVRGSNQHLGYKMQFGQRTSGYDKNGGLLRVDSPLALKLTLQ
nr:hypothetical protein [Tanacetum cinerariifolium]